MSPPSHKTWRALKSTQTAACRLRKESTPAERKLWKYLRNRHHDPLPAFPVGGQPSLHPKQVLKARQQ
jgi:very-short-patch-repair endonuclease